MLNFVLCDDNELILNKLCKMLESILIKNNLPGQIVYSSENSHNVLDYVLKNQVDVLLLDIDLRSDLSGLQIADKIRKTNKSMYLIFTTGHLEYGLVAYQYKTFDFISKPITSERLESTVIRLFDDLTSKPKSFFRLENGNTVINLDSVQYIQKDAMRSIFYTDSREYKVYTSFNKISEMLPDNFVRCHKSFIVNTNKITNINTSDNLITLEKGNCYIGPKYKNNLMEVFKDDRNI